jgi:hypothetical protein
MKIFTVSAEDEGELYIKIALTLVRIKPRAVPPKNSGIATSPQ